MLEQLLVVYNVCEHAEGMVAVFLVMRDGHHVLHFTIHAVSFMVKKVRVTYYNLVVYVTEQNPAPAPLDVLKIPFFALAQLPRRLAKAQATEVAKDKVKIEA